MHATIMAKFYRSLESKETNPEQKGKIGIKASQLEDQAEFEGNFLSFIESNSVEDFMKPEDHEAAVEEAA